MHQFRPAYDDYMFTIYYAGKKYTLRVYKFHSDRKYSYYQVFAKNRVLEFKYSHSEKKLTEELLPGQPASPAEFIKLLEDEFKSM